MADITRLSARDIVIRLIISSIIYTILLCLFLHFLAPRRFEDCPKCVQALANYRAQKEAKEHPIAEKYKSDIDNQSSFMDPALLQRAEEPKQQQAEERAYQQQLAEYRLKIAEERQRRLEQQRKEDEERAQQIAQIEKNRQERLKAQELQKNQTLNSGTEVSNPKKVTNSVPKTPKEPKKTEIGTLKTSKIETGGFKF